MTRTRIDTYDMRYAKGHWFVEQDEVREKASKDLWYLKESEDYMQEGYF